MAPAAAAAALVGVLTPSAAPASPPPAGALSSPSRPDLHSRSAMANKSVELSVCSIAALSSALRKPVSVDDPAALGVFAAAQQDTDQRNSYQSTGRKHPSVVHPM
jgi:hypothetical protein